MDGCTMDGCTIDGCKWMDVQWMDRLFILRVLMAYLSSNCGIFHLEDSLYLSRLRVSPPNARFKNLFF